MSLMARGLLWLLLAAWLLLALSWAGLQWVIVPRIAELRPELQAQASKLLGVTLRIGQIQAFSDGLMATVELSDVALEDGRGQQALHLQKVVGVVTPWSLWNLSFEQIYLDKPTLEISRETDGRIWVAGMDISAGQKTDNRAAEWLLSQKELVIQGGTLLWSDRLRAVPTLRMEQVDVVMRNGAIRHALRMDATPPAELGQRFTLMAAFKESLLSKRSGQWQTWEGQLYAGFAQVDVAQLRRYAAPELAPALGSGALRAWIDVKSGRVSGAVADVALTRAQVALNPGQPPLLMKTLSGRIGGRSWAGGWEVTTERLRFELDDGLQWAAGNMRYKHLNALDPAHVQQELEVDALNLATLSKLAHRLPVGEQVHETLQNFSPQGRIERLWVKWQGPAEQPVGLEARGRMSGLALAARSRPAAATPDAQAPELPRMLTPGVKGLDLDFTLTPSQGRATVNMKDGHFDLPGLFEQPVLPVGQLSAFLQWKKEGAGFTLEVPRLSFRNADAEGELRAKWVSRGLFGASEPGPGRLNLTGSLVRADAARIARYLPAALSPKLRHYLQASILKGRLSGVHFKVAGDLRDFPFAKPGQGEFEIAGRVENAVYAYVPPADEAQPEALNWPALKAFNADLRIDRNRLQLKNVTTGVQGADSLWFHRVEASIPDYLHDAEVNVSAQGQGQLAELLAALMKRSPLARMTGGVLAQAQATGSAHYQFDLRLPLQDMSKTRVSGRVTLGNNDLQIGPAFPRLSSLRGAVHFSERGFAVSEGRAKALGGEVRAEGGTIPVPGTESAGRPQLRVSGVATAQGLRQAKELGLASHLAGRFSGSARYEMNLAMRRGVPELSFRTNLRGMAMDLPEPLTKPADTGMELLLKTEWAGGPTEGAATQGRQDRVTLQFGDLLSAVYLRSLAGERPQVLSGAFGVGLAAGETVPLPEQGVVANVRLDRVDLDAWQDLLVVKGDSRTEPEAGARPTGPAAWQEYLPDGLVIQARQLRVSGRHFNQVVVGGTREQQTWRANMDAHELSGYFEYRQQTESQSGQVYARLARLALAAAEAQGVEEILDEQPASIPALDIVINDMELRGKKLGRIEIEATNRDASDGAGRSRIREWRLNKFNVILPEALLTATGNWTALNASGPQRAAAQQKRRTVMNFKLDIHDAGALLARLGMEGVIRSGKGQMQGQVAWIGSPLTLDKSTMNGAFNINVEEGQFLKADPGLAKLLGVLSLQSLPRRLTLDFRDVFSDGFAFDFVRGDVAITDGIAQSNNLQMKGVNAAVLMDGQADMVRETQDLKVVVVPEINAGTASLIATWINPAVGLGTFMAQLILRRPLIESATQTFLISGSWAEPKIERPGEAATAPPAQVTP